MLELVLPSSLSHEELTCAIDVATELELSTEKVNYYSQYPNGVLTNNLFLP